MPYSLPSAGRPGHRRSFSSEAGPGAFASLGALPRRTPVSTAKFHLKDEDDSSESEADDQDLSHNSHVPPPLKLKIHHQQRVPFPKSSPLSPLPQMTLSLPAQSPPVRPTPNRTSSTPILLSNGKPLKSSLKSSNSSSGIYNPHASNPVSHLRAQSAPATPNPEVLEPPQSPMSTPKNVHFPESSGLESVRIFNKLAKPASLLSVRGDETETETEGESSASANSGWALGGFISNNFASRGFPFPRISSPVPRISSPVPPPSSPLNPAKDVEEHQYVLDLMNPVPMDKPDPYGNVYLESLSLSSIPAPSEALENTLVAPMASTALYIHGTLLLRNIAYEKHASVRFTLDGWDTTSEVIAKYSSSITSPPAFLLPRTLGDLLVTDIPTSFDRFVFSIRLSDYLPHGHRLKDQDIPLLKKKLYLAIRYSVPGKGEWWDNCQSKNWGVGFRIEKKEKGVEAPKEEEKSRGRSLSAPAVIANGPSSTFLQQSWSSPPNPLHPTAPTNNLSSPNTTPPACPPLHERGFSEPLPSPPSHSPQHKAMEMATNARLSKFRLMNYAAPKPRTYSAPTPPTVLPPADKQQDEDPNTTPTQTPGVALNDNKADAPMPFPSTESFPFPPASPQPSIASKSLGELHWPWGQKGSLAEAVLTTSPRSMSRSPSPPSAPSEIKDEVVDSLLPPPPTIRRRSPPPSPSVLASLKLDFDVPKLERSRLSSTSSDDSDSLSVFSDIVSTPDGSMPPFHARVNSNPSSPGDKAANPMDSDLLYKAFVTQWCFGGADSSSPSSPPHRGTMHHRARGPHSHRYQHHHTHGHNGIQGGFDAETMGIEA